MVKVVMINKWEIKYYNSKPKFSPIYDFIKGLDKNTKGRILRVLDMLEDFGLNLGGKFVKKIKGTNLWELRIFGEKSVRIIYIAQQYHTFLLLHGFIKKTQKTPDKELKIALQRSKEYQ